MTKPYVDVAFVVPLLEEFQRLERYFPFADQRVEGTIVIADLDLPVPGLRGVAFLQDDMGKAAATRATEVLLSQYEIGVLFIIGIGGGLSGDVAVGDVCFTGTVIDVLENAKISDAGKNRSKIEFNSKFYTTDPVISFSLRYTQIGTDIRPDFETWQLERYYDATGKVPGEFIGRGDKNEVIGIPAIHDGSIVCGLVSKSDVYKSNLVSIERKVLAIETESGGVFASAQRAQVPAIAVRGICDYSDKNKNKLEAQTGGNLRAIAADNAVSFVKLQLSNPQFLRILEGRRNTPGPFLAPILALPEAEQFVASTLDQVGELIHQQLTVLSPDYRGKPRGYRLPLPRVQASPSKVTVAPGMEKQPRISILEAVASDRVVTLGVPRTFPDNSLPWAIASELSLIEIDGKQAVPTVIDGEAIKPPLDSLSRLSPLDLEKLNASESARPIIIVTDFNPPSRSRLDLLKQAIETFNEARFLILNREEVSVSAESELALLTGANPYSLCEISFVDISDFFQRTFKMPDQEAGVIAFKLQEMFRRFNLIAHPSYFAGVGGEAIYSLLRANRRSELLQLAVGGFLSFVVASDKSDTVLSRTTREGFLRRLAFERRVMKRTFDKAGLTKFAEEFAEKSDYEIDVFEFIKAFLDKGIIHFEHGVVEISLPFIESYLLASELTNLPREAEKYFDLDDAEIDFITFDIFAELSANPDIVSSILTELDRTIEELRPSEPRLHVLLSDEIRPALVEKKARIAELEGKIKRAFDDVLTSRPNSAEKQQIIDVAERVQHSAREAQIGMHSDPSGPMSALLSRLERPSRVWSAAIILLGSGSEQLLKEPKRQLAEKVVQLTSQLLDELMRAFPREDFANFKEELLNDGTLRSTFGLPDEEAIPDDLRNLAGAVMDAYEFSLLGLPMRAMFEQLGNMAGQPVLRPSVSSVIRPDPMENLIARVWAAEMSAAKLKPSLLKAIKELPPTPFLRFSLSAHFMTRVFWNHWEAENRLALLDAAEEALKPLGGGKIDKGRVKRLISAEADKPDTS